jgi:hypothetical protein
MVMGVVSRPRKAYRAVAGTVARVTRCSTGRYLQGRSGQTNTWSASYGQVLMRDAEAAAQDAVGGTHAVNWKIGMAYVADVCAGCHMCISSCMHHSMPALADDMVLFCWHDVSPLQPLLGCAHARIWVTSSYQRLQVGCSRPPAALRPHKMHSQRGENLHNHVCWFCRVPQTQVADN